MTIFGWFCAALGVVLGLGLVGIVILDCHLKISGQPTISKHVADITHNYPIIAASLGLAAGILLGALMGHLFFPENP